MHRRQYDTTDRERVFQHTWLKQYVWLEYRKQEGVAGGSGDDAAEADDGNMRLFCKTCAKYEKVGGFVVGSAGSMNVRYNTA